MQYYYYYYPANSQYGTQYSYHFERNIINGNIIDSNLTHLDSYKTYWGLNLSDIYKLKLDLSNFHYYAGNPDYIVISTKYGIIEYKELGGRIWSVTKLK